MFVFLSHVVKMHMWHMCMYQKIEKQHQLFKRFGDLVSEQLRKYCNYHHDIILSWLITGSMWILFVTLGSFAVKWNHMDGTRWSWHHRLAMIGRMLTFSGFAIHGLVAIEDRHLHQSSVEWHLLVHSLGSCFRFWADTLCTGLYLWVNKCAMCSEHAGWSNLISCLPFW